MHMEICSSVSIYYELLLSNKELQLHYVLYSVICCRYLNNNYKLGKLPTGAVVNAAEGSQTKHKMSCMDGRHQVIICWKQEH